MKLDHRTAILNVQTELFESMCEEVAQPRAHKSIALLDLDRYDRILLNLSGGKDSVAMLLKMLKLGVPKEKIVLWHQRVDGCCGDEVLFDWPSTDAYNVALAEAFGVKIEMAWRQQGILGEMLRENDVSKGVEFTVDGEAQYLPTRLGQLGTRRRFPAKAPDLRIRWCSAVAKIDVFRRVITNHPDYKTGNYLVLTGERREESANRARYLEVEMDDGNSRQRLVHRWRPVIDYSEEKVWDLYAEYGIQPAAPYHIGFSRLSCMTCIFSGPDHWATIRDIDPERFHRLAELEAELGHTIDNKLTISAMADKGSSFVQQFPDSGEWIAKALTGTYSPEDIFVKGEWRYPAGAFKGNGGGAS